MVVAGLRSSNQVTVISMSFAVIVSAAFIFSNSGASFSISDRYIRVNLRLVVREIFLCFFFAISDSFL